MGREEFTVPAFDLSGKVAIVTGGTKGLGYGIVMKLAGAGAKVVITSRHQDDCDAVAAEVKELTGIDGIGEAKACSIVAAIELSKRLISDHKGAVRVKIRDSRQVAEILMEEMMYEKREFFMTLNLNSKLQVESKSVISIGNLDSAPVHPREVFGPAVRRGAAAVVVAHNHPSGDPTPSPQDIDVTKRLIKASEILGIKLLDHVIIGNGCFTSMKSEGYFGN